MASPNAAGAAGDAAEAAFKRKLRRYRVEIRQLDAAGICYRPLVWTSNGRPHPAVTRTLRFVAEQVANRSEQQPKASEVLARCRHEIQVAIQRRRAAMTRAVLPKLGATDEWLLTGQAGGVPSSDRRAAPLDDAIQDEIAREHLKAEAEEPEGCPMEGSDGRARGEQWSDDTREL